MKPSNDHLSWFRCPCGFEAGGDRVTVENIHEVHQAQCIASRGYQLDQFDAARYQP